MNELVKKILDTAKEKDVDIGVAYDHVANEGEGYTPELKKAFDVLQDNFEVITALRAKARFADVKVICDMAEAGNENGVKDYIRNLKMDGVL